MKCFCKKAMFLSASTGMIFGVFDWYFPQIVQVSKLPGYVNALFVYGIWLIPALIIVLFNSRYMNKPYFIGINVSICWLTSVMTYYGYYVFLIAVPGIPQLAELQLKNSDSPLFKRSWLFIIRETFIPKITIWIPFAIVSGYIVGWFLSKCYQLVTHHRKTRP